MFRCLLADRHLPWPIIVGRVAVASRTYRTSAFGPLDDLIGHSITYRIAVGLRAGQKLFSLQSASARLQGLEGDPNGAARPGGFSLHAGIDIQPGKRAKLERACRYVRRPPVATAHLALTASGQMRYQHKTPYRDGTPLVIVTLFATTTTANPFCFLAARGWGP
jgi:hypothetical protein